MNAQESSGFSLIELVIILVIISVGVLGISAQFTNNLSTQVSNETIQQAAQYAQECAERVIETRRKVGTEATNGFDWFEANTFSCGSNPSGFTRTTNPVGASYTGNGSGPCPTGMRCRDVAITVTSTADANVSSVVNLLLVYY